MPFSWPQLVDVADFLEAESHRNAATAQAFRRSAVSRAYFGAFCCVQEFAIRKLGHTSRGNADDHGALIARLKGKWSGVATKLKHLRLLRNNADYDESLNYDHEIIAKEAIATAKSIISQIPKPP